MLVKAFNDYKKEKNLEKLSDEVKKISDYKAKNKRELIRPFAAFLKDTMDPADTPLHEMNQLASRMQFVNEEKGHPDQVLAKLNTKDLPEAEGLDCKKSQVGAFISSDKIVDIYGDEYEGIFDKLGKDSILVYAWGNEYAWWQRKIDDGGNGIVRIK